MPNTNETPPRDDFATSTSPNPYRDPNDRVEAPRPRPPAIDTAAVVYEMSQISANNSLTEQLDALGVRILEESGRASAVADAQLSSHKALGYIAVDLLNRVQSTYTVAGAARKTIADDYAGKPNPRRVEREDALEKQVRLELGAVFDTETESALGRFLAGHNEPLWPSPPLDLQGELQMLIARFPQESVVTFAATATDLLRRALTLPDRTETADARYRLNCKLLHVYGPLCERRAVQPERFARPMSTTYEKLGLLIRQHLATVSGRHAYDAAMNLADNVRGDMRWIRGTMQNLPPKGLGGKWDEHILSTGAPNLWRLRGLHTPK